MVSVLPGRDFEYTATLAAIESLPARGPGRL